MGSSRAELTANDLDSQTQLAEKLGQVIAERGCVLITGATTGFPEIVSRSARERGGLAIGISPASSREEHASTYALPVDASDVIVYTGFGLKGRNVVNVRSSDVVIIFGGGMGTLNEFTIAFDEGKVIGVLEGTDGVTDHIKEIAALSQNAARSEIVFAPDPEELIDSCLKILAERS